MRFSIAFFIVVVLAAGVTSCNQDDSLFKFVKPSHSGVHFNNSIIENDSVNSLDLEFLYNGGGIAAGDFNNDRLVDLYFTASMSSNKLYLNKGKLSFDDVTEISKTTGDGKWCSGASVIDINQDGWLDIYVCTTIKSNPAERKNILYINKGLNNDSIPVFEDMAEAYGLADTSYSVNAAFFDYDNDGDLDMYLLTTKLAKREAVSFGSNTIATDSSDIDKLFRNDWNDDLNHPVFTEISKAAGIIHNGYGLGLAVADIDGDGWKDIYVANDFFGSDLLYVNNKNGTFTEKAQAYFKHTSQNAMGTDIADINNDGLPDLFTVDMNPEDNFRKKKNMGSNNYFIYQKQQYEKVMLQYVRNTFQLNRGNIITADSPAHPVFSDISFYTGTAQTDWSWSVLMADGNNDGFRDIFITNGYPKDVTDHDFAAFRLSQSPTVSKKELLDKIPQVKIPNYVFENKGGLNFENARDRWGMKEPGFSNGAIMADLDNDGDLDYVVNNINDKAWLYQNTSRERKPGSTNYINVFFNGTEKNRDGIGAIVKIYYDSGQLQVSENAPCRGYLSSADYKMFFGVGTAQRIDSVVVLWPGFKKQKLEKLAVNQTLILNEQQAQPYVPVNFVGEQLFEDETAKRGIKFVHNEMDHIDFDHERLIPHKLSQYGPGLAVSDINADGLDDIFVGAPAGKLGQFFIQQKDGTFREKYLPESMLKDARKPENMGLLLFDADNDGDDDLYCASGSNEFPANTKNYQDQFYINDGNGNFHFDSSSSFPVNYTSKSSVKAADYDGDGDLDLFLGGRCLPGRYPFSVNSYIYRNDSKEGIVRFSDVTKEIAPVLLDIGIVCDAVWTDFDNDDLIDLIVAGEWMPVTFLKNQKGKFVNANNTTGVGEVFGSWNSIVAGDFNNDGWMDYAAGNMGLNSFYKASDQQPVNVYAGDFDNNGTTESIVTVFLPDKDGNKKEFPAFNRDDIVSQMPGLKKKFLSYKDFGSADIHSLLIPDQMKQATKKTISNTVSSVFMNQGNGRFVMKSLPPFAQFAPVFAMVTDDVDGDGHLDIILTGNDHGNEVSNGRYDGLNGLVLKGNGKGDFSALDYSSSGIFIPGDGKALVYLKGNDNSFLLAASENRGPLRLFKNKTKIAEWIRPAKDDRYFKVVLKNGSTRKQEIYMGHSFLSQSTKWMRVNNSVQSIEAVDVKNVTRIVYNSGK